MKFSKITAIIVALSVLLSSFVFPVTSASGTKYESEANNNIDTADRTYDDYNNYGQISTSGDWDYWVVSFEEEGMVNFYLGNIPSGCNYNLVISKYNATTAYARANQSGNTDEMIRLHVKPNMNYYIRVFSPNNDYSLSWYKLRVKWYPMNDAKYFAYNESAANNSNTGNSIPTGNTVMSKLWSMNFPGYPPYINNSAQSIYSTMPTSQVVVMDNHGGPGNFEAATPDRYTYLYANTNSNMTPYDYAITSYPDSALINTSLVIFSACYTGANDESGYNLVDSVLNKGAFSAIGWRDEIYTNDSDRWLTEFFTYCAEGYSVGDAAFYADFWVYDGIQGFDDSYDYTHSESILNRYHGSSRAVTNANGLVLDLCE